MPPPGYNEIVRWAILLLASIYAHSILRLLRYLVRQMQKLPWNTEQAYLWKLCRRLPVSNGNYRKESEIYSFEGKFQGRDITIVYRYGLKYRKDLQIHLAVTQKFWLRLLPSAEMAAGFQMDSDQPKAARQFLKNSFVENEIQQLSPLDRLEIHKGRIKAIFIQDSNRRWDNSRMDGVLNHLHRFAHFYELEAQLVKVWFSVPSDMICPYCREHMDRTLTPISQCDKCGVRLHQTCWLENGQCTTWGCASTSSHPH